MAKITTIGSVGGLLAEDTAQFDQAAEAVMTAFAPSFAYSFVDILYGAYDISTLPDYGVTNSSFYGYLYDAQGELHMTGSGFFASTATISTMQFTGDPDLNPDLDWNLTGSLKVNTSGLTSATINSLYVEYGGDSTYLRGNLKVDSNGDMTGSIKEHSVSSDGVTLRFLENVSVTAAGESGNYKSVEISDASGNKISFVGSVPASTWDSEALAASTVNDLFDSPVLLAGNDTFVVPGAERAWHGFDGNDSLTGGSGADDLFGDSGNDKLFGLAGADHLYGGAGNDKLDGGEGEDELYGDDGSDPAQANNDRLLGGNGDDRLFGGYGNDKLDGGSGNDYLDGEAGTDRLTGGLGDDTFIVDALADKVVESAGGGTDLVISSVTFSLAKASQVENIELAASGGAINATGNALNNQITGNASNNVLNGRLGADSLTGDSGNDTFVFDHLTAGVFDTIQDFNDNDLLEADLLGLSAKVFKALAGGVGADNLVHGTVAADGNDFLIYDDASGSLYYDADGSGAGAAIKFCQLESGTVLTASDFTVL